MEINQTKTTTFDDQLRRVLSTTHDVFDGWQPWDGLQPGSSDVWVEDGSSLLVPFNRERFYFTPDENVRLGGASIKRIVQRLSSIDHNPWMSAMAATIREEGYSWCDACEVFAIHTKVGPDNVDVDDKQAQHIICESGPIANWVGAAPDPQDPASCNFTGCPAGMGRSSTGCVLCAEGEVSDGLLACEACPPGSQVIDFTCMVCDMNGCAEVCLPHQGFDANGVCQECLPAEMSINSVCQPCPNGTFGLNDQNTCVTTCPPNMVLIPEIGACQIG